MTGAASRPSDGSPTPPDFIQRPHVAFIGLGAMGLPMAQRLLECEVEVAVFDLQAERLATAREAGARAGASLANTVSGVDIVCVMVVNAAQAHAVLHGPDGVIGSLRRGSTVIVFSTIGRADMQELHASLKGTGVGLVDAPVSGGVARARTGDLLILVGAEDESFDATQGILGYLGSSVIRCGSAPGAGQEVKLVNQLLCGVHIAVAAEALGLARSAGLDPALVLQALGQGAASSFMLNDRGPRMLEDDPEVRSAVDIFVKDLDLVLDQADRLGARTPLTTAAAQLFHQAATAGLGRQDDSQLIRLFHSSHSAASTD